MRSLLHQEEHILYLTHVGQRFFFSTKSQPLKKKPGVMYLLTNVTVNTARKQFFLSTQAWVCSQRALEHERDSSTTRLRKEGPKEHATTERSLSLRKVAGGHYCAKGCHAQLHVQNGPNQNEGASHLTLIQRLEGSRACLHQKNQFPP